MEAVQTTEIQKLIEAGLENSMDYAEYRNLVSQLANDNGTTGPQKTEALINYTKMNDRRMKRWDKTLKISDDVAQAAQKVNKPMTWIVLTESWCGDAAHVMPAINKVAELSENISFKVVLRDDNEALMDAFLTNGSRSIPKIIILDDTSKEVLNSYGPRPSEATKMVNDYKAEHGALTPEFKEDLQRWYNKDKGQTIFKDALGFIQ